MKKIILVFSSFMIFGCTHLSSSQPQRDPAQASDFSVLRNELNAQIKNTEAMAQSSRHATKIYDHGRKTEKSILIIHGLHESPAYMQGFAEHFHSKGYNVLSLRLPGHLTKNPEDLNRVKASEWIQSAEQAFQQAQTLGEKVEILGYSTGGTLAVYLALKMPQEVKALYLVAPALALKNRVFASTLFVGWTGVNLNSICKDRDSKAKICKIVLNTDHQLKQMLEEGLVSSLSAGAQVQVLINQIVEKFGPQKTGVEISEQGYYQRLRETYLQLKMPLAMVNSESDTVVNSGFNENLMKQYQGPQTTLTFPKNMKITHLMLNKSRMDAFKNSPESVNPSFEQILETFDRLK